jgi:hypothetical protein
MPGTKYPIPAETHDDLENRFTHHPPEGDQSERYQAIRQEAYTLAENIVRWTPRSREQSLALTNLEQAIFWANAAIARNEPPQTS